MKKVIAFLSALILMLSVTACTNGRIALITNNEPIDKNDVASYVGYWKSAHMRFRFLDNGTGFYDWENTRVEFHYEIQNEAVTLVTESRSGNEYAVLGLSDDGTSLYLIENGLEDYTSGETEFSKADVTHYSKNYY